MKHLLTATILGLAAAAASPAPAADEPRPNYEASVVGLNVTFQRWNEDRPWEKLKPETRRVAAVMVDARHILTTADSLNNATFIQVVAFGRSRAGEPHVERIDRSVNLALLSLGDSVIDLGLKPVELIAKTPASGTLRTVRWRSQQLEVAASRIIRIDVEKSLTSNVYHAMLRMRTDLAGGGWAEPVFSGDRLAGLTMSQSNDESRAIPSEMLRVFLAAGSSGESSKGVPTLGAYWQVNRDSSVSRFLGQDGEPKGILIRQVAWGTTACGGLKPRDLLLEIDGEAIDAEGYYQHSWFGRIGFDEILAERYRFGDRVPAKVLRDGREQDIVLTARSSPASLRLVPSTRGDAAPYLIAGGLVFRELDGPYLRTWGKEWDKDAPSHLLARFHFDADAQTESRRRNVILSSVLPSPYNVGYQDLRDVVIERVNDRAIGRIEDLAEAFRHPVGDFHVIELSPEAPRDEIVLDAPAMDAATARILEEYHVPAPSRAREDSLPDGGGDCEGEY